MLMLKQSFEATSESKDLVTVGTQVNLGTARDIATRQSTQSVVPVSITVHGDWQDDQLTGAGAMKTDTLDLTFRCDLERNRIDLASTALLQNDKTVLGVRRQNSRWIPWSDILALPKPFRYRTQGLLPWVTWPGEHETNTKEPPEQMLERLSTLTTVLGFQQTWAGAFARMWHIMPLRSDIPRTGQIGKLITTELGFGGERLIVELNQPTERARTRLVHAVNKWMTDHHMLVENLRLQPVDRDRTFFSLVADDPMGGKSINVADMGMGVTQALPIVTQIIKSRGTIGFIEQPELHLHPAAQADMADLFIDYVRADKSSQLVIETHSEHILLRLRRRIAEGAMAAGDVAVLFVTKEGGQSRVTPLNLTEEADFEEWPKGFFEEGYVEALALARAAETKRTKVKSA